MQLLSNFWIFWRLLLHTVFKNDMRIHDAYSLGQEVISKKRPNAAGSAKIQILLFQYTSKFRTILKNFRSL